MDDLIPLLGDIVHRLNSPLGAIRARIELIKNKKADLLERDEYLAKSLEAIERDAAKAFSIVAELRETYRISKTVEPTSVSLALATALSQADISTSIEVVTEIEHGLPNVLATKSLVDVFRNLIVNLEDVIESISKIWRG